jgi:hypothetical protein
MWIAWICRHAGRGILLGGWLLGPAGWCLPEGNAGLAAKYPEDRGIAADPAVIFHDDFEAGELGAKWDSVYHAENVRIAGEGENVHGGKRALELSVPRQQAEVANAVVKKLGAGYDTVFLRYYSKFEAGFDQLGSSHNGGFLAALAPGLAYATPGVRADGRNKFMASLENWRDEAATPSPGDLNVYCYHPEQRSDFGDHLFPSGKVLPLSYKAGDYGPGFVARGDVRPELGRWYCYELMLKANTPGERNGEIACWLDGKLVAHFPMLRLRDAKELKVNHAALDLHIRSNPVRVNRKHYDDVVIATSYVGPRVGGERIQR